MFYAYYMAVGLFFLAFIGWLGLFNGVNNVFVSVEVAYLHFETAWTL